MHWRDEFAHAPQIAAQFAVHLQCNLLDNGPHSFRLGQRTQIDALRRDPVAHVAGLLHRAVTIVPWRGEDKDHHITL